MKPSCKTFWHDKTFLRHDIPLGAPKYSASDTALGDIFSQLCKHKQLKRYKAVIDNCLKSSEKKYDLPNNEADIQDLKLKGPGPFTLKNNFEPMNGSTKQGWHFNMLGYTGGDYEKFGLQTQRRHRTDILTTISSVMVSVLASSVVYSGFEPWSGQTRDYKIGICCFSAKHAALRRKSKDWLARNQDNVSEWSDISTADCCFSELAL